MSLALGNIRRPVRRIWNQANGRVGLVLLGTLVVILAVGPVVFAGHTSSDFYYQDFAEAAMTPSWSHPFGTDAFGRDVAIRLIHGGRYTLTIAVTSVAIASIVGVVVGVLSGYFGRWVDLGVQRVVDVLLAVPSFLLALALVAILGASVESLIVSVAVSALPRFARIVRASVLSVKERGFVIAGRAAGLGSLRIMKRHVLPNSLGPVIVQTPLELGSAILTAAGLGFLGLGVQQPTPEWGSMLGAARNYITTDPYLMIAPGICIVLAILSFNLIGDAAAGAFDPRTTRRALTSTGLHD